MADFNPRPTQWIMKLTDAELGRGPTPSSPFPEADHQRSHGRSLASANPLSSRQPPGEYASLMMTPARFAVLSAPCPQRNPPSTLIVQIAQWLEHLAETDENFDVALYGDKFLRQFVLPMKPLPQHRPSSKVRRKAADRRDGDGEHDTVSFEKQAQPRHSG
ncbi:hypothetical protein LA080_016304 [Diaporthe eres]|nr:hypothetical protein LA080_016304 [Diaporthe eres]